ncbi:MAG TPA: hypothetical protein DCL75_20055 [Ktedonobacter sp.]|nr:hypothetical protein [Ktedonobacter sp.]
MLCLKKVSVIVKQESTRIEESHEVAGRDKEVVKRRAAIATICDALPVYGSITFWEAIEAPGKDVLPLEVLVRCVRDAVNRGDESGRRRIFEMIFRRIHTTNEYWANNVLKTMNLQAEEQAALAFDLYADLCECIMRALIDTSRLFWEEHFQHCLSFERRHVFRTFMTREGRWNSQTTHKTSRIPRMLVSSLEQAVQHPEGDVYESTIADENAQKALLAVEHSDLPYFILDLPDKLKSVVLLVFWEGRTEKDTASVLGITDRTVRNRLQDAYEILRNKLEPERELLHG